jgi:methionine synthase I (cobalamin-dependent)
METETASDRRAERWRARRQRIYRATAAVWGAGVTAIGTRTRPALAHLREHGYSICGLGCIAGAAFVHSIFSGLLVLGILFLVFEWKVSD